MDCINQGMKLQDVVDCVTVSPHLLAKPYLVPQYDQIEFIVRNIWRLHAGWWDGNPSHLEPASDHALSSEIVIISGGVPKLQRRIIELMKNPTKQNLAIAGHLVSCV